MCLECQLHGQLSVTGLPGIYWGEQGYVFVSVSDRDIDRVTYTVGTADVCRIRRVRDAP